MRRLPPHPALDWTADGAPRSRVADDVYFSSAGGLDETRAVFLSGCGLPDRWRNRRSFAIGELGFGSGLNALATWALWRQTRRADATLQYVSIESAPLDRADAARALTPFADVAPFAQQLLARWPVRAWGPQRLWFADDGFALTVLHADAADALAGLDGVFDAWFLDGFAPARNPAMWSDALIARMAALSAPDARVATYSVAGAVRRALADAGFAVEKKPGFAGKRQRLEAWRDGAPAPRNPPDSTIVIGAGIAGACMAQALTRRGVAVTVLDAAEAPASAASGNPAALLSPRLDRADTGAARLHRAGYLAALDHYSTLGVLERTGIARRSIDAAARADLVADPPLPDEHMRADADGLYFAQGGLVRPQAAIAAMLDGAAVRCNGSVAALTKTQHGWAACDAAGAVIAEAAHLVVASGAHLDAFAQTRWAPIELSRGQIEWGRGAVLTYALEDGAYAAPFDGGVIFGATFDRLDSAAPVQADAESRARNCAALARLAPTIAIDDAELSSRAAIRAATQDRTPLAGAAPDASCFGIDPLARHEGLWLLGGFGSRGFTLAPLLAESLASRICGDPDVLDAAMAAAVDPARYLRRAARRVRP